MLGHGHNQWDFRLDGFFHGLCRLVAGHVDGRSIWSCCVLSLTELIDTIQLRQ